jgi:phosphatidate cytidylyltransferase
VWVADIGAYFSGRRFGRHKLAPAISPGKTREGVIGGLMANLLWMLLVYQFSLGWGLALLPFLIIGLATSLISVVGDLFESVLKREAGVKDSGKLLPGHGGVLDRVDSVIAAAPIFISGFIIAAQL